MTNSVHQSKDVLELLDELSGLPVEYPSEMLAARRTQFVEQVGAVVIAGKGVIGQGDFPVSASAPMTPLMKTVLTALIIANLAVAGYIGKLVYDNYDRIVDWLNPGPSVSQEAPVSPGQVTLEAPTVEETPSATQVSETPLPTVTVGTPSGEQPGQQPAVNPGNPVNTPAVVSTPQPIKTDPGLHLGQTPRDPGTPPGQGNNNNGKDK